jgi:pimeloyl-ACP methyl ester carboxylesterase
MHIVYLHGFASSPDSSKARFFRQRLAECDVTLHCPDLNKPDFSTLTVSRMIGQVEHLVGGLTRGPVTLIGSSLGAFVAVHVAERAWHLRYPAGALADAYSPIERLVLLAPALDFGANDMNHLGPGGLDHWRSTNRLDVEHYAEGRVRHIHYGLYEDAQKYDSFATVATMPTLVLQGQRDDLIAPAMVERFSNDRTHVTLVPVNDGHQLTASLDKVWRETVDFLQLSSPPT